MNAAIHTTVPSQVLRGLCELCVRKGLWASRGRRDDGLTGRGEIVPLAPKAGGGDPIVLSSCCLVVLSSRRPPNRSGPPGGRALPERGGRRSEVGVRSGSSWRVRVLRIALPATANEEALFHGSREALESLIRKRERGYAHTRTRRGAVPIVKFSRFRVIDGLAVTQSVNGGKYPAVGTSCQPPFA